MLFDRLFQVVLALGLIALAAVMTLTMAGAVYANRNALPVVGVVFTALVVFGLFW